MHGAGLHGSRRCVAELVRHALADMLTRGAVHDPVVQSYLITVPEVRMTADLQLATIYVVPLGGRDADAVLAALERNKRFLRGEIARRVNLKFAPEIRFRLHEPTGHEVGLVGVLRQERQRGVQPAARPRGGFVEELFQVQPGPAAVAVQLLEDGRHVGRPGRWRRSRSRPDVRGPKAAPGTRAP